MLSNFSLDMRYFFSYLLKVAIAVKSLPYNIFICIFKYTLKVRTKSIVFCTNCK